MRKMSLLSLVKNNNIDGVRDFLLNETININIHKYENIALIAASKYNYIEIVKLLLEVKNINVNLQDKWGRTALIIASNNNYKEIVKLLLDNETININLQDNAGGTALIYASVNNYIEIIKLLLTHKTINVNIQSNRGKTALMYASYNINNIKVVKLLLAKGATTIPVNNNYLKKINEILTNWKTYLPRWNRFNTYKYYPEEFNDIVMLWLLICKRKNFVSKDIKLLMIEYFAESWKFEIKI